MGNTILAAALIDDVLGLIALTIVSSLSGGQDSIALVPVSYTHLWAQSQVRTSTSNTASPMWARPMELIARSWSSVRFGSK